MSFYPGISVLLDQGRYKEAEAKIRSELAESIDDSFLYFLLSLALLNQSKPKEAESAANEAIRYDPEFDMAHFALSRALYTRGRHKEALRAIDEAIRIDPEYADHYAHKAQILVDRKKVELALEATERGLASDPENESCRFFRGICLERLGRCEEAEEESLGLLAENPEDADNHNARGWILIERGDTDGAERHFVEALRIFPEYEDAREGLIYVQKLKNPILGLVLKALIWMDSVSGWWLLVGVIVVMQLGDKIEDSDLPFPVPFLGTLLRVVIYTFFVIALMVSPLFNAVLSRSSTSRYSLTSAQVRGVKWYFIPILISFFYLGYWVCIGARAQMPVMAVAWASLAAIVFQVFEAKHEWVSRRLALIALGALAVVLGLYAFSYLYFIPELAEQLKGMKDLPQGDEEAKNEVTKELADLIRLGRNWTFYPVIGLWLLASYADDLGSLLRRRAPD